MARETTRRSSSTKRDRVLGDEWLDWQGEDDGNEIREGKRMFLLLSLVVLIIIVSLVLLFWYLIIPRFEQYGRLHVIVLNVITVSLAAFLLLWYLLLFLTVLSGKSYLNICLRNHSNLLHFLFPLVLKLAKSLGISKDRLSHSFIKVSNELAPTGTGAGNILALLPRCLKKELKQRIKEIAAEYPNVVLHTAPGGNVARKIIIETNPRAIVAIACERDLVSGIQDVSPKIPVIGIPNSRPVGPCKDTSIDLEEFRSALTFFNSRQ
jgi:hypothetical protein